MDGWNRIDDYNILANPYTTTRSPVTLGERQLFTQIPEPFKDDYTLGDINLRYDFGKMNLTSITSYSYRDILVVRDAGALTSSITGGSIGLPEAVYTLNAPLNDATHTHVATQELRLFRKRRSFAVARRRVLQQGASRLRPDAPRVRVRGGDQGFDRGPSRAEGCPVLLRPRVRSQAIRSVR
jgi:hypothetical protein